MLVLEGVSKKFRGGNYGVCDLSLSIGGGVLGLLGPNGAGKTTLIKMLFGLVAPTTGTARVVQSDVVSNGAVVRRDAAFVSAERDLPAWMKAGDLARQYAMYFPDWDSSEFERLIGQWAIPLGAKVGTLSRGMRGKLLIAMALARKPHLLVLDEPTDGMDPAGIEEVLTHLVDIAASEATTVLLATHRLDEVERVCDRVAILVKGKIVVDDDSDALRAQWKMSIRDIYLAVTNYDGGSDAEANAVRDGLA
jgi:ABC-2 type transport system ATP-binding protein